MSTPTKAAMAAAARINDAAIREEGILSERHLAAIIDRETHLPELLEALRMAAGAMSMDVATSTSRTAQHIRALLSKLEGKR